PLVTDVVPDDAAAQPTHLRTGRPDGQRADGILVDPVVPVGALVWSLGTASPTLTERTVERGGMPTRYAGPPVAQPPPLADVDDWCTLAVTWDSVRHRDREDACADRDRPSRRGAPRRHGRDEPDDGDLPGSVGARRQARRPVDRALPGRA